MPLVAGIDVGGTNLRVGVVDGLNIIYEKRTHADFSKLCKSNTPEVAWQQILAVTATALNEALQQYPQIISVGIGFPGFIDPENGLIAQSPNLPGLKNVDLAGDLAPIINRPVIVENDALAAAYGEFRLHGTDYSNSLIYVGLGTGVGGGLIHANRPFTGEHGVAMEIGHIIVEPLAVTPGARLCGCGNHGCLEQYASASGISISYAVFSGNADTQRLDASQIAALAITGDQHALAAYAMAGDKLGQALAHIVKVVDVGHILIGGGVSGAWSLMQTAFDQRLQADLIPLLRNQVKVTISPSGDQAGIIGAALIAAARSGI